MNRRAGDGHRSPPNRQPDVLVIGAGVIGLTCAVALAEAGARVEVLADRIPGAASRAAGALWGPYLVEPKDRVRIWALAGYQTFRGLADSPDATGVRMMRGVEASRLPAPPPDFTDMVPDLEILGPDQLPSGFSSGVAHTAPLIDMPVYLGYLLDRLQAAGSTIRQGHVAKLRDAAELAPCVVNAAGLGARELVPDPALHAIRGQLVVIDNPGVDRWFSEDTGDSSNLTHWYPQGDKLVLGGLAVEGDESPDPDPDVAQQIVARCAAIEPALAGARILEHRVGLRPTRPTIRLGAAQMGDSLIVHCYGFGGAGVTLSWGCSADVLGLATDGPCLPGNDDER